MAIHRFKRRGRVASAFSAVELLIALAVIAVLAAMAAPRFGGAIGRYRSDMAVRRIVSDLRLARALAMSRSAKQAAAFDQQKHCYELIGMSDPDRPGRPHRVELARHPYEANLLKLDLGSADAGGRPTIVFDGYGVPDAAGTIVIGVGSIRKTIIIAAETGAMTVQ